TGNVFVTGSYKGSTITGGYAIIAYSNAGVPLWTNLSTISLASGSPIATDSRGSVFVTGSSWNGSNQTYAYATIKYSNGGVPLWTNRYYGAVNLSDTASAIAVDRNDNDFV